MRIISVDELGARMRDQRLQLGLSQAELARRIGASRYWIMQVEHGNAGAEIGLVLKALAALRLDVDVRGEDAPAPKPTGNHPDEWTPDLAAILDRARGRTP